MCLEAATYIACAAPLTSSLIQQAGGLWEPGSRRWLIHGGRIESLIRCCATDPLFRYTAIDLNRIPP
jgi:hypothetical protein